MLSKTWMMKLSLMKKAKERTCSEKTSSSAWNALIVKLKANEKSHCSDYAENQALDTYSEAGLNDEEEFEGMTVGQRRAAERALDARDRREKKGRRGTRAALRSRAPDFLGSEESEEEGPDANLLSGIERRVRWQYDERLEIDDA